MRFFSLLTCSGFAFRIFPSDDFGIQPDYSKQTTNRADRNEPSADYIGYLKRTVLKLIVKFIRSYSSLSFTNSW